jgi:hypothetical protein
MTTSHSLSIVDKVWKGGGEEGGGGEGKGKRKGEGKGGGETSVGAKKGEEGGREAALPNPLRKSSETPWRPRPSRASTGK